MPSASNASRGERSRRARRQASTSAGNLWVCWCGQPKGLYDIFVQRLPSKGKPVTEHFTFNLDDAMSCRLATGPDGSVTVACYQWRMLWGSSRDRDIFARTFNPVSRIWSDAVEVSPHEPEVEDHSDPDVAIDGQGRAWVAWSFDYHPSLYPRPLDAAQPTIFAAQLQPSNAVSAPILAGATGQFRDAIDLFPSAVVDDRGVLWCAWDCSEPQRCIRLARLDASGKQFVPVNVFGDADEVCSTPELSAAGTNGLLLAWSSRSKDDHWSGKVALLKEGLAAAETVVSEPVDVLFPQVCQAPNGVYWLTYEKCGPGGSEVVLRNVTAELQPSSRKP